MKAGEIIEIEGREFRLIEADKFRCVTCDRETFSALCGCDAPILEHIGRSLVGLPLEGELTAIAVNREGGDAV